MNNSDGSLNFDTSINTDGVEEGTQDIKALFERVIKAIESLGDKLTKAFDNVNVTYVTQEVEKVDTAAKKTEKQVHRTKKALDSLDDVDGPAAIKAQIEQDTVALEKLKAQQSTWDDIGAPKDSGGYQALIAQITELEQSIAYAKTELQELSAVQSESSAVAGQQSISEEQAAVGAKTVADAASRKAEAQAEAKASDVELEAAEGSLGNSSSRLSMIFGRISSSLKGLGSKLGSASGKFRQIKSIGTRAFSAIKKHITSSDTALGGFGKKLKSSISMYSRVFKMMLMFELFSSGMELIKTQVGGALTQNAQFCASLAAIKGNLEIAFQPIYNAILPALNTLMAGIRQATIWLASFTHTLFGGSVKSSVAAAQAIDAQADSTKNLAKETKKAAKAQSELDEFNIISDNGSSDPSSGTGGSTGVKPSYGDANLISGQNAFAEKLKEAWKNSDFTEIGQIVADKINDALNGINWESIQGTAQKIALCLGTLLNGFVGELDWSLVGTSIANGLNTGLIFAYTFLTTFNFLKFGQSIGTLINAAVSTFDWALLGQTIAAGLNAAFDFVYGFVTTMDWAQLGTSIGTAISNFFQNTDWAELGMDVSGLVLGLLTLLLTTIQGTDWSSVGTAIGEVLSNIDWAGIFQAVWDIIVAAFGGLQDVLTNLLTSMGMDPAAAEVITNFALALGAVTLAIQAFATASQIATPIAAIFGTTIGAAEIPLAAVVLGIAALIAIIYELIIHWNDIGNAAASVWDGIVAIWSTVAEWFNTNVIQPLVLFFSGLWQTIVDIWKGTGAWFGVIFTAAWNAICSAFSSVGTWFSDRWTDVCNAFSNTATWFGDIFSNAWNGICNAFSAVGDFFGGVWNGIKNTFGNVADWFGDKFSAAWQAVKDVFSTGGKVFDGITDGILGGLKGVVNAIIGGINKVVKLPFDGLNGALGTLRNISIAGISPFTWLPKIGVPQIPFLATGAVIPANSPFMAMLGDQKHGNNIETPESLMRQVVSEEVAKLMNSMNNSNQQIKVDVNLMGEMANLFTAFVQEYHKQSEISGKDPLFDI